MAITFGAVIEDRSLFTTGIKSNIISLLICIIIGYVIGMIAFIWKTEWNPPPMGNWFLLIQNTCLMLLTYY